MEIIEYNEKYIEDVKDLMVELEEYIVEIDKDNLDQVGENYREKYVEYMLQDVKENDGKVYVAVEDGKAIGVVAGIIKKYNDWDKLDYKCPKTGMVTELVTGKKQRSKGVGKQLLDKIEEYFKLQGCKYVSLDVFAYNENAIKFYANREYHARMHTLIKKL